MELKDKFILVLLGAILVMGLTLVVQARVYGMRSEKVQTDLQNQLALKDKTIEENKGLYEKLALETKGVKDLLSSKDVQVKELEDQLKKNHEQLAGVVQVNLDLQKALEGTAKATQTQVSSSPGKTSGSSTLPSRERVDFTEQLGGGFIGVTGYTMTNPPEAYLKLQQLRPLKLTVAVSQDKTGAWHSYVTSSEEGVRPDISLSGVDPYVDAPRWYEKLALRGDLGVGSTSAGAGVLFGLGATYEVGRFDVGPAVWMAVTDRVDKYVGVTVGWHPFKR